MIQYLRRSPSTLTASGICIEIVGDRRNVEGVGGCCVAYLQILHGLHVRRNVCSECRSVSNNHLAVKALHEPPKLNRKPEAKQLWIRR
jgi:hypothetical protein